MKNSELDDYKPIACVLHEQYQFTVMKRIALDLVWDDDSNGECSARVLPKDVYTHDKAEYLLVFLDNVGEFEIRLDRIREARWVTNGSLLAG